MKNPYKFLVLIGIFESFFFNKYFEILKRKIFFLISTFFFCLLFLFFYKNLQSKKLKISYLRKIFIKIYNF